jgi:glutaredoxin-like protein
MLDEKNGAKAKELLGELDKPVKLIVFTQEFECDYCRQNIELMQDVSELSDKISIEVHDFRNDKEVVDKYGIDKIPAVVVEGEKDYGIRFFGLPSGYEFVSLIDAVRVVSTGDHQLAPETMKSVEGLGSDMHVQVFVTPTCPYCPRAVVLAHRLAYVSDRVKADMVEAMEFPHLANKYGVMGVPRSIINEDHAIEGAVPEPAFINQLLQAEGG